MTETLYGENLDEIYNRNGRGTVEAEIADVVESDYQSSQTKIPKISDNRLNSLYEQIKPVIRVYDKNATHQQNGELYNIKDVDLRGSSFLWDPKPTTKADGLEEICEIETYHTYGYHGFFKPSIAEVISQIPDSYVNEVAAFETMGSEDVRISEEYHITTTVLYRREK